MSSPDVPPGVGRTALMTASARMAESRRPDRLFTDPWASALVGAALEQSADGPRLEEGRFDGSSELWDMFALYFPGRTPFFDRHVTGGVADGARQVVLLAAGLDARAGRLDLPPGVPVYELDTDPVLRFKGGVLAAAGLDTPRRVPVPVDLSGDWLPALEEAGFRPDRPTVWVAEGLLFYLDAAACDRLLTTVRRSSAPGSRIATEYFDRPVVADDVRDKDVVDSGALESVLALFEEGPPAPPAEWLPRHGFGVAEITGLAEELVAQGREVPRLFDHGIPGALTIWLAAGRVG